MATAGSSPPGSVRYRLYYWPIPFRGVFIQYLLDHAGVDYDIANFDETSQLKSTDIIDQSVPCMAPPMLHDYHHDRYLSQMPAIVTYLAGELGYSPNDTYLDYQALKVLLDSNDVLSDLTNANGSQMWTHDHWQLFRSQRLVRWLGIFEETGRRNGLCENSGYLLGTAHASYADIAAAALFGTMARCLPELDSDIRCNAPAVHGLCRRIEASERIQHTITRQQSEIGNAYCGGQIEQSIRSMLALDQGSGEY